MAKLLLKDLSISTGVFKITAKVHTDIVVVTGDSSTGKTLWYDLLRLHNSNRKTPFVFINASILQQDISFRFLLSQWHNRIIFVDNADIVVPRDIDIMRAVASSDCQFVFLGRDVGRFAVDYNCVASMKDEGKGIFSLQYLMTEGWIRCQ